MPSPKQLSDLATMATLCPRHTPCAPDTHLVPQTRALCPIHVPCDPPMHPGPSDMRHSFSMCCHPPRCSDPPGPSSQDLRCDSCMPRPIPAMPLCSCTCCIWTALMALTLQAPGPFCMHLAPSMCRPRAPCPSLRTPTCTHASHAIHTAPASCPGRAAHALPSVHVPHSHPHPSLARHDIASEVPGRCLAHLQILALETLEELVENFILTSRS